MKTKTIYHLDVDCNLVKVEKRTTLWGVVVKRVIWLVTPVVNKSDFVGFPLVRFATCR
ncbi:hypothetical protein [Capnocytophaga sp. H2931]|uniref:hypothetical protein n=1 Tax=Capnocytophaga sp. H2931 TaxID=1945657 RepID=UPI0012FF7D05|nr:hypothetical protein [Capnocytophaga sp. H2931]